MASSVVRSSRWSALTLVLTACACGGEGGSGVRGADSGGGSRGNEAGAPAAGAAVVSGGASGAVGVGGQAGVGVGGGGMGSGGGGAGGFGTSGAGTAGAMTIGSPRPQLIPASADEYTVLKYLAQSGAVAAPQVDGWDPTAGIGDVAALTPRFRVAASGGTHTTVQAAIDAAVAVGGTDRISIELTPGTYREVVCVPSAAPPITLFSKNANASATVIVYNNYSGKSKEAAASANPCSPAIGSTTYGTSGSATFAAYANAFQAKNITFENDTDETGIVANAQAVALSTQGDRQIYENVRLLGNQDTFFVKTANADVIARVYVKTSFIQGDTDFVFGRGTLVIDSSEIRFISTRQGSKGYMIVPSTDARNRYGILVFKTQFTADSATLPGQIHLGRAWDESGKDLPTYAMMVATGIYPNGQALVRECSLGAHIRGAAPWAEAATTKRPFSSVANTYPANRMFEFGNTGPGAPP